MKKLFLIFHLVLTSIILIAFGNSILSDAEVQKIQSQLKTMVMRDQVVRNQLNEATKENPKSLYVIYLAFKMGIIDRWNTHHLNKILNQKGWPQISVFGEQADQDAWLLVQHADHDLEFQKHCLGLLENLVTKKETKLSNVAYLYDRVAVKEIREQKFGTQGDISPTSECWEANPIEDTDNLDQRRKQYDLKPFAVYRCEVNQYVGRPQCC